MERKILSDAYALLSPEHRTKGWFIILLLVLNSVLDFFTLASFLPLIILLVTPSLVDTNVYIQNAFALFGFTSPASFMIAVALSVMAFVLLKNVLSSWIAATKAKYAYSIGTDLCGQAMQWHMSRTYLDYSKADFSREMNIIANYPMAFANNIVIPSATILSESLVCLLIVAGIAFFDPKILILLIVVLLPITAIYTYRKKTLDKIRNALEEKYPMSAKYALQAIESWVEISIFRKEKFFKKRFQKINRELANAYSESHVHQTGTGRLTEIIAALIVCFLIVYALLSHQDYKQTILLLGIYASACFRVIPSVNRILHASIQIRTHQYLVSGLQGASMNGKAHINTVSSNVTFNEKIELKNISLQFPLGPKVLANTDMTIHKGQKIAITGDSGEGKSTLLLLLLAFLKPDEGSIVVDNHVLTNTEDLRNFLTYIPQAPYMLDASVAQNIAFGVDDADIDQPKVMDLVESLELGDFVRQLPQGVHTRIGEKGLKISGGQRQRLAIARALYGDADILLLDEVTNQVHATLEAEIMEILNTLALKNKTIIMVTHKTPDNNFFDSIYRLEKGKLLSIVQA